MTRPEKAKELFENGYNCAQAVFCAFEDVTGMEHETALRFSAGFGGG
ncbi:MAG: C-GCAxxG-C-C family protein, partial [Clostridia bacterium]|nr:C-GCAxxG-C-C family protein [Clostridia bacterium]